jgi:hypothetical protein
MITRERIAEALERAFGNPPTTFSEVLRRWTEHSRCGHLVAKAITRVVEDLSGRSLAWYYDPWVSNDPTVEPYLIAFILVNARTKECLTLNATRRTPHVVFSIETLDDAIAAGGYFLSLLGVAVEDNLARR